MVKIMTIAAASLTISATAFAGSADTIREALPKLEARWTETMEKADLPGFAVAITDASGTIYSKGFGLRSVDPALPYTADSSTYIASITKVYVTLAIMQLVDAGKVDLDTPVKTYLPRFELSDPELTEKITIRDLLCHRYGINAGLAVFHDAYTGLITDDIYYRELKLGEIEGSFSYTNVHFTILGRVIESVTGETWRDYLDKHVFEPAGMHHTTGYTSEMYGGDMESAVQLRWRGEWMTSDFPKTDETMHAAGGLGSSVNDMARWIRLHLNNGEIDGMRILSEESMREIFTTQEKPGTSFLRFQRNEIGLGWYLGTYEDKLFVHHFGGYIGTQAHCSFMPDYGVGVAVVANSGGSGSVMIHHVAADVYDVLMGENSSRRWKIYERNVERDIEEAEKRYKENQMEPGPLDLSAPIENYAGVYEHDRVGPIKISVDGDKMSGGLGNIKFDCYPGERDEPKTAGNYGRIPIHFVVEGDDVTAIQIPEVWDEMTVFSRKN